MSENQTQPNGEMQQHADHSYRDERDDTDTFEDAPDTSFTDAGAGADAPETETAIRQSLDVSNDGDETDDEEFGQVIEARAITVSSRPSTSHVSNASIHNTEKEEKHVYQESKEGKDGAQEEGEDVNTYTPGQEGTSQAYIPEQEGASQTHTPGQEGASQTHTPGQEGTPQTYPSGQEGATAAGAEQDKRSSVDIVAPPLGSDSNMSRTERSRGNTLESVPELPPAVPEKEDNLEPVKGLSGDLPTLNYPPPPPPPKKTQTSPVIPPPGLTRKVSSPFAWFSRARKATSPSRPDSPRRDTASSLHTLGSNADSNEDGHHQPTLKDRFHILRLQGESAISTDDTLDAPRTRLDRANSLQSLNKENSGGNLSPPYTPRANSFSALASPITSKLPRGTAAGADAGPSEDQTAVNWDLWQAVVYEGPSVVARTSGDELAQALAGGIPQPIRGVVWQVLAESKNEELELVYRELVARGTDKEPSRPPTSRRMSMTTEKESLASSASSIRSDVSAALSPILNGDSTIPTEKKTLSKDEAAALAKLEKTIKRDLGARTSYSKYLASAGLQDGLFGMCKAYALYDDAVGYAQGMNFIAMPLLFNMPEEEAFTLFVRLMSKYNLRSLFTIEMTGLHLHLYLFERLLEDYEPALYCHLHRRGVPPNLYATQWFLTLFAYRFPLQLVLRVYDLVLSEGLGAILKFGIALMQRNAQTLLEMKDMVQLSTHLKEKLFDVYIDKSPSASSILESGFFGSTSGADKEVYRADELVRDACALKIAPETITTYTAEFEEKTRSEKDRELELETLRNVNANLTSRVRKLEERSQKSDLEHVDLASELIRTRVDNDKLQDENEVLRVKVEELRKVVDTQPAEVEERLKQEMERIMQRNIEVQNSNRALEDTVQETEQELVGTKMMFAQLNAEHDALKQKLSNVQNMLKADE